MKKSDKIFNQIMQFTARVVLLFVILHPKEMDKLWTDYPLWGALVSAGVILNLTTVSDSKIVKE